MWPKEMFQNKTENWLFVQGREAGERAGGADREDEGERAARGGLRAGKPYIDSETKKHIAFAEKRSIIGRFWHQ